MLEQTVKLLEEKLEQTKLELEQINNKKIKNEQLEDLYLLIKDLDKLEDEKQKNPNEELDIDELKNKIINIRFETITYLAYYYLKLYETHSDKKIVNEFALHQGFTYIIKSRNLIVNNNHIIYEKNKELYNVVLPYFFNISEFITQSSLILQQRLQENNDKKSHLQIKDDIKILLSNYKILDIMYEFKKNYLDYITTLNIILVNLSQLIYNFITFKNPKNITLDDVELISKDLHYSSCYYIEKALNTYFSFLDLHKNKKAGHHIKNDIQENLENLKKFNEINMKFYFIASFSSFYNEEDMGYIIRKTNNIKDLIIKDKILNWILNQWINEKEFDNKLIEIKKISSIILQIKNSSLKKIENNDPTFNLVDEVTIVNLKKQNIEESNEKSKDVNQALSALDSTLDKKGGLILPIYSLIILIENNIKPYYQDYLEKNHCLDKDTSEEYMNRLIISIKNITSALTFFENIGYIKEEYSLIYKKMFDFIYNILKNDFMDFIIELTKNLKRQSNKNNLITLIKTFSNFIKTLEESLKNSNNLENKDYYHDKIQEYKLKFTNIVKNHNQQEKPITQNNEQKIKSEIKNNEHIQIKKSPNKSEENKQSFYLAKEIYIKNKNYELSYVILKYLNEEKKFSTAFWLYIKCLGKLKRYSEALDFIKNIKYDSNFYKRNEVDMKILEVYLKRLNTKGIKMKNKTEDTYLQYSKAQKSFYYGINYLLLKKYYEYAIDLLTTRMASDTPRKATLLKKIISIYLMQNKFSEALQVLKDNYDKINEILFHQLNTQIESAREKSNIKVQNSYNTLTFLSTNVANIQNVPNTPSLQPSQ